MAGEDDPNPRSQEPNREGSEEPNRRRPEESLAEARKEFEMEKGIAKHQKTAGGNSSWFTPKRLLIMFSVINLITYIDRGAIASNGVNGRPRHCSENGICSEGSGIQGTFALTNFKDGIVSSAFMVGLLVASPIFASASKSVNPFRLIGVGLAVWTVAVAFCGFSFNFWSIAIARMLVGVGEASFISLAAPFIDDNAPAAQKIVWLGTFYMCIPTGIAAGYVYGGVISHYGWRWAFWVEAILMLPFVILGFVMKPLNLKGFDAGMKKPSSGVNDGLEDQGGEPSRKQAFANENLKSSGPNALTIFGRDMKALLLEKVFVVNVLGYIAYSFVIGSYSYWGPKAGYNIYQMENADYMFGGVTAVTGILGSLAGGFVLDRISSTISNAFKLLSLTTLVGAVFCFVSFCLKNLYGFLVLFAVGELLVFSTQAPVNFVCLHCVEPSLRPLSMAMSTVCIHIFGDVPSSPLVGLVQDHINNWRSTTLILTSIFFIAAAVWGIGIFMNSVDRYDEEEATVINPTPLEETAVAAA